MWKEMFRHLPRVVIRTVTILLRKVSIGSITFVLLFLALENFSVFDCFRQAFLPSLYSVDEYLPVSPEASMKTVEIIRNRGYPVEIHPVTTEDGYILELHRIPSSVKSTNAGKKRPVFLQHGILANDFVWVTGLNDNALAYYLADRGYDVWLGNSRGNTYSRKHVKLDPEGLDFWDFSWNEMSRYDLPSSFNYILKHTNQSKLSYVGYSLGCTLFFASVAERPELDEIVDVMIGLGPTAFIGNMRNGFHIIARFNGIIQYISNLIGFGCVLPADGYISRFGQYLVASCHLGARLGALVLNQVFGYSEAADKRMLPILIGHYPSGGSIKSIIQFFENYNSGGKFTKFNYGPEGNLLRYGTTEAPDYDLSKVKVPVHLFWGATDPVVPPEDVERLSRKLGNLRSSVPVNADVFGHGDFFMSTKAAELVNRPAMELLPPPYNQ